MATLYGILYAGDQLRYMDLTQPKVVQRQPIGPLFKERDQTIDRVIPITKER